VDRVFKFVEMSGFLTICHPIKLSHILMVVEMQMYFYYIFKNCMILILC